MKASAVLCVVLALPLSIIAAAMYPTIRNNEALVGALSVGALITVCQVAMFLANAHENRNNGMSAAAGIQAATGNYPPGPDVIDVQHRIAQTRLADARAAQLRGSTPGALPAPMFAGGQVDDAGAWDAHMSGGWGNGR